LDTQSRPGEGWGDSSPEESARRSVYMFIKRSLLSPLHTAFDFPDVDTSCEARFVTVQPGQADIWVCPSGRQRREQAPEHVTGTIVPMLGRN